MNLMKVSFRPRDFFSARRAAFNPIGWLTAGVNRFASTNSFSTNASEPTATGSEADGSNELELRRNKSRLNAYHYQLLHGKQFESAKNPVHPYQGTVAFKRKMAAKYGEAAGINLGISWPTPCELDAVEEYERVAFPFTLQQMMESSRQRADAADNRLRAR